MFAILITQTAAIAVLFWKLRQVSKGHEVDQLAMESMGTELLDALKRIEDLSTLAGSVRRCEDALIQHGIAIEDANEGLGKLNLEHCELGLASEKADADLGLMRQLIDLKYENLDLKISRLNVRVVEIETAEPAHRNPEDDDPLGSHPNSWLSQAAAAERGEGVRH